ncbi:hypothetical protein GUD61_002114 [Salmonella enterica]|nr:hypothetical protein [Salmonella enterica]
MGCPQTNRKTDTGKTLNRWPVLVDHFINTDGDYIVGSIDYTGDTRGQAWYMDLLCLAKGGREILSKATIDKGYLG